jgi:hypothetical protein
MFGAIRRIITRSRFEHAFSATLPACRDAVSRATRQHRRPDAKAVQAQREALHRALAHGRKAGA